MGTVYSAMDDVLERPVAVKVIREDAAGPLDLVSRFRREARAAAGFAHPHVVRVYDFGVDRNRRPFLVMELLEGCTLRQRLVSPTPFSAAEVLHILRGVCAALSAAHGRGLVHRDLKPENIFLQSHPSGVVPKVLDFGLAKALDTRGSLQQSTAATSAGILVGTLEYMAPEQAAGGDVSPGWDIWAVAVMTYEMLTGSHPFRRTVAFSGDSTVADVAASARDSSELPDTILAFFRTALSIEPALRPGRAADFLTSFEQALR
jgi:serine/threonine protein kinase